MTEGIHAKSHFIDTTVDSQYINAPVASNDHLLAKTKLFFTIGPSSQSVEVLTELLNAGCACARINLSWAPLDYVRTSLRNLQEAMKQTQKICAICLDIMGREIYVKRPFEMDEHGWPVHTETYTYEKGDQVVLTTKPDAVASKEVFPVNYDNFHTMPQVGDMIFIGRYLVTGLEGGSLFLEVKEISGQDVICEANNATSLSGLVTVFHAERSEESLVNQQNDQPVMTAKDKQMMAELAKEFEIDFVSVSHTRDAKDIQEVREFMKQNNMENGLVIAKVESRVALFNFRSILASADAIMCSRGNLGVDCIPEKITPIQKNMVSVCNMVGKPIVLTRVLDSMVNYPRPTRAEATDVANAVLDGIDGIVLGAETLRGLYPVSCAKMVLGICRQAEKVFDHNTHFEHLMQEALTIEKVGGQAMALPTGVDNGVPPSANEEDGMPHSVSAQSLTQAISAMTHFSAAPTNVAEPSIPESNQVYFGSPIMSKSESIASSAVRTADKIAASLILVLTSTGYTAGLVSKYRPNMSVMSLVVPELGRHIARQCQIHRGIIPVLAEPGTGGHSIAELGISKAAQMGLVGPNDYVVVVDRMKTDFCVKILSVNEEGTGAKESADNQDGVGQLQNIKGLSDRHLRAAMIHTLSELPQDIDIEQLQAAFQTLKGGIQ
eukprot:TRINITY_DN1540_c0_g1_i2.p1 TRINITY_DN1540_c0_g1~~TRINITY_DN1540_c0_g1_i2.p1  ORF type:complete len:685 (+),score=86.36 TRINITY_DN1540_c0_g1_i2:65-2056(+)